MMASAILHSYQLLFNTSHSVHEAKGGTIRYQLIIFTNVRLRGRFDIEGCKGGGMVDIDEFEFPLEHVNYV